jgi:hypothetical protein
VHVSRRFSSYITKDYPASCLCNPMRLGFHNERRDIIDTIYSGTRMAKTQDCNPTESFPLILVSICDPAPQPTTSTRPSAEPPNSKNALSLPESHH